MTQAASVILIVTAFVLLIFVFASVIELKRRWKMINKLEKDLNDYVSIADALKADRNDLLNRNDALKDRVNYLETILAEIKGIADVD